MKLLTFYLSLAFTLLSSLASGQNHHGYLNSEYAGIMASDLQPAAIADSRFKFDMTIGGGSLDIYNTYLGLREGSIFNLANVIGDSGWIQKETLGLNGKDINSVYFNNELVLPSFQFDLNNESAIGFRWKIRTHFHIDGVGEELSKLAREKFDYSQLWNQRFSNEFFSIQSMSWVEYGVNYGRVIMDKNDHFLKLGGSFKLLQGLQAIYLFVEDLKYQFSTDDTLSLFQSDVLYGHSTNYDIDSRIRYRFVSNPGVGIDLGVVYEWRPDWQDYKYDMDGREDMWRKDLNKYKLKAGLSILDIGRIKFQKGNKSRNFIADVNDWDINNLSFNNVQAFDDTILSRFSLLPDEGKFNMNLPTAFSTQLDYNIGKGFFVNLTTYHALQFKEDAHKVHGFSNYQLAPRYDHRHFSAMLPLSYSSLTGFRAGLGMRFGWVYFGTSNLAALAGLGRLKGGDAYVGFKIPIYHKVEKDDDNDAVSNKFDKCKDVPGVWAFKGCPDTDNDMIPDSDDKCPAEAGLVEFGGCPDTDRDGVPDNEDECVTVAGLKEFSGCPDTDGDGVPDKEDECPDIAGLPTFNGCPDTDEDGLADKVDNCPLEAGPTSNLGCPLGAKLHLVDRYGDIVATAIINSKGEFEFKDIKGDGSSYLFLLEGENEGVDDFVWVTMVDDMGVPTRIKAGLNGKTGYFEYRKIDGESNLDPLTLLEEETIEVLLKDKEQALLNTAFENLEFEPGKAIIKDESFQSLSELVNLLKTKSSWKIKISGHTDNVGVPAKNLILSKRRAEAVQLYLVQRGIPKERTIAKFYGQTQPISENDTAEGRAKNRRVEMKIVE